MKGKKIIICNGWGYYGGTLVLSALCKILRELGYDARVIFVSPMSLAKDFRVAIKCMLKIWWGVCARYVCYLCNKIVKRNNLIIKSTPVSTMQGIKIQYNPFFYRLNSIVLYPEVVYGNPLRATNVVRWLLYHNKFSELDGAYGKNDLFVAYRKVFNDIALNPHENILRINYFDSNLYRQYNFGERKGCCYILRKGRKRIDLPNTFAGPCYDDDMSQEDLVKMFNEYKYCYSYDTQTFYTRLAAVCGCIPIVVLEPGKTEADYLGKEERKHFGVAYGDTPEQIQYAIETRSDLLKSLDYDAVNKKNAEGFIELLKSRFGEIARVNKY